MSTDTLFRVSIGSETLTGDQIELLYKAIARMAGDLGVRVSENRFDADALKLLADATRIATLLSQAMPKKPLSAADE
jgi:molybdopterin-biosynthesis enzyme MoeA-like protein